MNFYKLDRLINEYGSNLINSLMEKFQKEEPGLTITIIKNYIDRFERIKNNLPEKDIQKYSWHDLENAVDGYQSKDKIKAGKLDPTATDANLLLNQNGIRIYLGKDKKSCIKYSNGYSFCIGARGDNNMYSNYRINFKGTPYFVFNDNLPQSDPRHILVLFVYGSRLGSTAIRYTITDAHNKGEKKYSEIKDVINDYPWMKNITNFVNDVDKGIVEPSNLEKLEYKLDRELSNQRYKYQKLLKLEETSIAQFLSSSSLKEYKDYLNNDSNIVIVMIHDWIYLNTELAFYYKTKKDILNKIKQIIEKSDYYKNVQYKNSDEDLIRQMQSKGKDDDDDPYGLDDEYGLFKNQIDWRSKFVINVLKDDKRFWAPTVAITIHLESPKREFVESIINRGKINDFMEYKIKHNKVMNYIKTISEEKLEKIIDMDRSWDTRFENYSLVDDIIKNYIS